MFLSLTYRLNATRGPEHTDTQKHKLSQTRTHIHEITPITHTDGEYVLVYRSLDL